jgi:hypothetical protein
MWLKGTQETLYAGFACADWIAERLLGANNPVGVAVDLVASHAFWIAGEL